jgi:hypothetical protein
LRGSASYLSGTTAKRPINISRIESSTNVKVYPFKAFCLMCGIMYADYILSHYAAKLPNATKQIIFFLPDCFGKAEKK